MDEQQKLTFVLEALNRSSPAVKEATRDLEKYIATVEKAKAASGPVGGPGSPSAGGAATVKLSQDQLKAIRAAMDEEKRGRALLHASAMQYLAAERREQREADQERERYLKWSAQYQRQRLAEEERQRRAGLADERRQRDAMHASALQAIRAEERLRQQQER